VSPGNDHGAPVPPGTGGRVLGPVELIWKNAGPRRDTHSRMAGQTVAFRSLGEREDEAGMHGPVAVSCLARAADGISLGSETRGCLPSRDGNPGSVADVANLQVRRRVMEPEAMKDILVAGLSDR
jgi:hypothetical protein